MEECDDFVVQHDEVITAAIRGFSGGDLVELIRKRPSVPLLALLHRRLQNEDGMYVKARRWVIRPWIATVPTFTIGNEARR